LLKPPGRRESWMIRRLITAVVLVGVTLIAATAVQAGSPPATFTDTFNETVTMPFMVPCRESLGLYDFTVSRRGVFHVTAAAIDEEGNFVPPYHRTITGTGTFVAVPSDGTGPTFTGRYTEREGESEMITHSTGTLTFSVRATGSDGSQIRFHLVTHYTINALGIEFGFEKPRC